MENVFGLVFQRQDKYRFYSINIDSFHKTLTLPSHFNTPFSENMFSL